MELYDYSGTLISANSPFAQKKWTLLGDDLTELWGGKTWDPYHGSQLYPGSDVRAWEGFLFASRIGRELQMPLDNRAKSGSNIYDVEGESETSGTAALDDLVGEIEAGTTLCPDYITVAFGTNTVAAAIGTEADTSAVKTTVCGATRYFVEKLRFLQENHNPRLVFGFVLPPQTSRTTPGYDVRGAREAMKAVLDSEEFSAWYVDMWTESGITADMLADGVMISDERSNNLYYHAMRRFLTGFGKLSAAVDSPPALPIPAEASVGQVLKVAAVGTNGKVTAVLAEDLPAYPNLDEVSY